MNSNLPAPNPNGGVALGILLSIETGETITVKNINNPNPKERIVGGTINEGETIEEALEREIQEETGLIIQERKWLMCVLARSKVHYYHVFGCPLPNFDGLNTEPVKDGKGLLICRRRDPALLLRDRTIMVPQHRIMLDFGIQKIKKM